MDIWTGDDKYTKERYSARQNLDSARKITKTTKTQRIIYHHVSHLLLQIWNHPMFHHFHQPVRTLDVIFSPCIRLTVPCAGIRCVAVALLPNIGAWVTVFHRSWRWPAERSSWEPRSFQKGILVRVWSIRFSDGTMGQWDNGTMSKASWSVESCQVGEFGYHWRSHHWILHTSLNP